VGKGGEEMKVTWRGGGEAVATVRSDEVRRGGVAPKESKVERLTLLERKK
jgi:hypothetical protein